MSDVVDLASAARALIAKAGEGKAGRASESLLHGDHQRVVLIALLKDKELAEHESPLAATLHVLTGRARLHAGEQEWLLGAGEMVAIPPERHAVTALDDCVLLLTVSL